MNGPIRMPNHARTAEVGKRLDAAIAGKAAPQAAPTVPQADQDGVILVNGSTIKPEPVAWLWRHWLALGKFHVLAGPPGQGKTTIALSCIATVSKSAEWPDGTACEGGNVLIWSGEDDPQDTLLPRLMAMGADVSRVYFIDGTRIDGKAEPFDPARDMAQLQARADQIGDIRLLVVDPVVSAVAGDSNKNAETRRALQPMVDLAAGLRAAVLGISHFTKGSAGRDPVERVTGSLAFGALARVVLCAVKVKTDDEDRRILARAKSNIGPDDGGFEYSIEQTALDGFPEVSASVIVWGKPLAGTARELLADAETETDDGEAPEADVDAFVRACLVDGPRPAKAVKADADGAGHSWRTVQRAANRIGVERRKEGMRGGWVWAFKADTAAPRCHEGAKGASQERLASTAPSAATVAPSGDQEAF